MGDPPPRADCTRGGWSEEVECRWMAADPALSRCRWVPPALRVADDDRRSEFGVGEAVDDTRLSPLGLQGDNDVQHVDVGNCGPTLQHEKTCSGETKNLYNLDRDKGTQPTKAMLLFGICYSLYGAIFY